MELGDQPVGPNIHLLSKTEQPFRVSPHDALVVPCRQFQTFHERVRILDVHRRVVVGADDDPVGSDEVDHEPQGLRIVRERVVMEAPHVLSHRALQLRAHRAFHDAVIDPPRYIREAAAGMRQHDIQLRKLVEHTGEDELMPGFPAIRFSSFNAAAGSRMGTAAPARKRLGKAV